jgi:hypothetical protein
MRQMKPFPGSIGAGATPKAACNPLAQEHRSVDRYG